MGPLISAAQQATVRGYLDEVDVAFAGSTPGGDGFWVPPSVVTVDDPARGSGARRSSAPSSR